MTVSNAFRRTRRSSFRFQFGNESIDEKNNQLGRSWRPCIALCFCFVFFVISVFTKDSQLLCRLRKSLPESPKRRKTRRKTHTQIVKKKIENVLPFRKSAARRKIKSVTLFFLRAGFLFCFLLRWWRDIIYTGVGHTRRRRRWAEMKQKHAKRKKKLTSPYPRWFYFILFFVYLSLILTCHQSHKCVGKGTKEFWLPVFSR